MAPVRAWTVWVLLAACTVLALARPAEQSAPAAPVNLNTIPPGKGPEVDVCPAEPRSRMVRYKNERPACGAACQTETRRALLEINRKLLRRRGGGVDWSNDVASEAGVRVNFTTGDCNTDARYCTVLESVDLIPGDPNAFLFGGQPDAWLPSYCCWRGVVCCTSPNVTSIHTPCAPYSVIALILRDWPTAVDGTLQPIMGALALLDKWGLQQIDFTGNYLEGPLPAGVTRLRNLRDIVLADNCELPGHVCVCVCVFVCVVCVCVCVCLCASACVEAAHGGRRGGGAEAGDKGSPRAASSREVRDMQQQRRFGRRCCLAPAARAQPRLCEQRCARQVPPAQVPGQQLRRRRPLPPPPPPGRGRGGPPPRPARAGHPPPPPPPTRATPRAPHPPPAPCSRHPSTRHRTAGRPDGPAAGHVCGHAPPAAPQPQLQPDTGRHHQRAVVPRRRRQPAAAPQPARQRADGASGPDGVPRAVLPGHAGGAPGACVWGGWGGLMCVCVGSEMCMCMCVRVCACMWLKCVCVC